MVYGGLQNVILMPVIISLRKNIHVFASFAVAAAGRGYSLNAKSSSNCGLLRHPIQIIPLISKLKYIEGIRSSQRKHILKKIILIINQSRLDPGFFEEGDPPLLNYVCRTAEQMFTLITVIFIQGYCCAITKMNKDK